LNTTSLRTAAAAIALLLAPAAFAALPFGSLSFVEPTGTAGPDDVIDVRLRFTLDMNSAPLQLVPGDLSGFVPEDLPTEGRTYDTATDSWVVRPFEHVTGANLNVYFSCNDTFTNGCNGAGHVYTYDFHFNDSAARPSAIGRSSLVLLPGESFEYVFATFTPPVGGAPAGDYAFYDSGLTLEFTGTGADGNFMYTQGITLGNTCAGGAHSECAFTRTITAVPEPQAWLLMALGLVGVAGVARRRA